MMKRAFILAPIATLALVSAQTAAAQQSCVAAKDLTDTITYAMPLAYDATRTACDARLRSDGFLKTGGVTFVNRFRAKQDTAWPGARRVLTQFAMGGAGNEEASDPAMIDAMTKMPDDALRPFVDALASQKLSEEIKPETCSKIERVMALISPLPVENVSGLATLLFELTGVENPSICAAPGAGGAARPAAKAKPK